MNEIDAFAQRLAARTANRGHRRIGLRATDSDGLRRQHDGRNEGDKEASPEKMQCLSADKENSVQRLRGLAALRQTALKYAAVPNDKEMKEPSPNALLPTKVDNNILPPQRLSTTLDAKVGNVKGREPVKTPTSWDSKEAQGFSRTPSASKLVYAFPQSNEVGADSSIAPPLSPPPPPPPAPITPTFSATKMTDKRVGHSPTPARPKRHNPTSVTSNKGNQLPPSTAAPLKPARLAVLPESKTGVDSSDPSTMSLREKRALFDRPKLRHDPTFDETPSPAPELLTVSERAALFERAAATHARDASKTHFKPWPPKRQSARDPVVSELADGGGSSCESQNERLADGHVDIGHPDELSSPERELHLSEESEEEAEEDDVQEEDKEECGEDTECVAEPHPVSESGSYAEGASSLLTDEESPQSRSGKETTTEQNRTLFPVRHSRSRLYPELPPLEDTLGHSNTDIPAGTPICTPDTTVWKGGAEKSPKHSEGSGTVLAHTLSMYRRQQKMGTPRVLSTGLPTESVVYEEKPAKLADNPDLLAKIRALQREAESQAVVMAQASQALELCRSAPEFMGSSEQVEGERLLLLANHRRQACLAEAERLRTLGAAGPPQGRSGGGTLTIGDLQLPLKRQFLAAQLQGKLGKDVHHFVCLVREGEQLRATELLSTSEDSVVSRGSLCFSNHMALHNLSPDFRISFLVYALQTQRETLPHDRKYHIRKESNKLRLTPKSKKQTSKPLLSPVAKSSVRTSSFGLVGSLQLSRSNCHHRSFVIDKVPANSPLEGTLLTQAKLTVEHNFNFKGFLSMFEQIRGFGAWHRRWCVLSGPRLTCWSYPEDEGNKEPMGHVELSKCIRARRSSRDECARPHAFVLEQHNGELLIMAADTKEERSQWCSVLGDALSALECWGMRSP